jgi:hypothetical protein
VACSTVSACLLQTANAPHAALQQVTHLASLACNLVTNALASGAGGAGCVGGVGGVRACEGGNEKQHISIIDRHAGCNAHHHRHQTCSERLAYKSPDKSPEVCIAPDNLATQRCVSRRRTSKVDQDHSRVHISVATQE